MKKMWFVSENGYPLSVFDDREDAIIEKETLAGIEDRYSYKIYGLTKAEIEANSDEYEDEFQLAEEEGYIS